MRSKVKTADTGTLSESRQKQLGELISILRHGGIAVIPTDTIYGIVARAFDEAAIEKVYHAKHRPEYVPCVVLISSVKDISLFGVSLSQTVKDHLEIFWPGKVSITVPCSPDQFFYIHRGKNSIAFRVPANEELQFILNQTGPLIAPSANLHGKPPATNISDAKKAFGASVDYYLSGKRLSGKPSTLISFDENEQVVVLREGSVKIPRKI